MVARTDRNFKEAILRYRVGWTWDECFDKKREAYHRQLSPTDAAVALIKTHFDGVFASMINGKWQHNNLPVNFRNSGIFYCLITFYCYLGFNRKGAEATLLSPLKDYQFLMEYDESKKKHHADRQGFQNRPTRWCDDEKLWNRELAFCFRKLRHFLKVTLIIF